MLRLYIESKKAATPLFICHEAQHVISGGTGKLQTAIPFLVALPTARMAFIMTSIAVCTLAPISNEGNKSLSWPNSGLHANSILAPYDWVYKGRLTLHDIPYT